MKQTTITCTGRDGEERDFSLEVEETRSGYELRAFRPGDSSPSLNFVVVSLRAEENGWLRVTKMDRNIKSEEALAEKGIPEALLEYAGRNLGQQLVSSTNKHDEPRHEFRCPAADKVWGRLRKKGMAKFSEEEDRWYFVP